MFHLCRRFSKSYLRSRAETKHFQTISLRSEIIGKLLTKLLGTEPKALLITFIIDNLHLAFIRYSMTPISKCFGTGKATHIEIHCMRGVLTQTTRQGVSPRRKKPTFFQNSPMKNVVKFTLPPRWKGAQEGLVRFAASLRCEKQKPVISND